MHNFTMEKHIKIVFLYAFPSCNCAYYSGIKRVKCKKAIAQYGIDEIQIDIKKGN